EGARALRRRVEVRLIGLGAAVVLRRRVETEDLLAAEEVSADRERRRLPHTHVDAVEAAFVADHELLAAVDEVRVLRAEPTVLGEEDLRVLPTRDVLLPLQEIAEAVDALV